MDACWPMARARQNRSTSGAAAAPQVANQDAVIRGGATIEEFAKLVPGPLSGTAKRLRFEAYRIESADTRHQGVLAATYQTGYRLAMIWAGAGALWLAARAETVDASGYQQAAWQLAYLIMAASMLLGPLVVLCSPEPQQREAILP